MQKHCAFHVERSKIEYLELFIIKAHGKWKMENGKC